MKAKVPAVWAVIGPTASGKTAAALRLAEETQIEIISMDSALVYRGMDIGTAKPDAALRAAVPHHLIDILPPTAAYSAAEFVADSVRLAAEIRARGRQPVLVGGTMMYYHALTAGLHALPSADADIRAQIAALKAECGSGGLWEKLRRHDPAAAARLKPGDSQRIERALEIFLISGKPMSAWLAENPPPPALNLKTLVLLPEPRARLHAEIAARFRQMLEDGFLDEVRRLRRDYPALTEAAPAVRAVGYRQAWAHLDGKTDNKTFIEQGIAATRQLAKRQITWLRRFNIPLTVNPYAPDADPVRTLLQAAAGR